MTAVILPRVPALDRLPGPADGEQRLLLYDVSWEAYVTIGASLPDRGGLRLTYDRGSLEFLTTSPAHERYKHWLGRFIDEMAEEFELEIAPYGSPTFQREGLEKALEPDQCYWIAHELHMRGKLTWDAEKDPPPDLTLEIELSRSAIDRMGIYAALGVPEVWRFDGETLRVERLQPDGRYEPSPASPTFPGVPMMEVVRFLRVNETLDYLGVVRSFRTWLRAQRSSG